MCPVAVAYITELSDKKQPIKVQYMDGSEIQIDDRINRADVQNEYESLTYDKSLLCIKTKNCQLDRVSFAL